MKKFQNIYLPIVIAIFCIGSLVTYSITEESLSYSTKTDSKENVPTEEPKQDIPTIKEPEEEEFNVGFIIDIVNDIMSNSTPYEPNPEQ